MLQSVDAKVTATARLSLAGSTLPYAMITTTKTMTTTGEVPLWLIARCRVRRVLCRTVAVWNGIRSLYVAIGIAMIPGPNATAAQCDHRLW